jgi:hypothetical protein
MLNYVGQVHSCQTIFGERRVLYRFCSSSPIESLLTVAQRWHVCVSIYLVRTRYYVVAMRYYVVATRYYVVATSYKVANNTQNNNTKKQKQNNLSPKSNKNLNCTLYGNLIQSFQHVFKVSLDKEILYSLLNFILMY